MKYIKERMEMQRLGASIIMISKGTPFFLAGEEMLRSKDGNSNSYNASDEINNIDWDALTPGSDAMRMRDFYRALIAMRKANPFLRDANVVCTVEENNVISVQYTVGKKIAAQAFINPNDEAYSTSFIGLEPGVLLRGWEAYETPVQTVTGDVQVEGHSVLLVKMP